MKFQLFLFIFLLLSSIVYFKTKKSLNTLKWFAILFSMLTLPCYFLLKVIDLASMPISLMATNLTKNEKNIYFIRFYEDMSPIVTYCDKVKSSETRKTTLEIYGVSDLWCVATSKNEEVFIEKATGKLYLDQQFLIKESSKKDNYKSKVAKSIIRKFWIKKTAEYTLLILNIILIVFLLFKILK